MKRLLIGILVLAALALALATIMGPGAAGDEPPRPIGGDTAAGMPGPAEIEESDAPRSPGETESSGAAEEVASDLVTVLGKALLCDGSPASEILVSSTGHGSQAVTDSLGRFELLVRGDEHCTFHVVDEDFVTVRHGLYSHNRPDTEPVVIVAAAHDVRVAVTYDDQSPVTTARVSASVTTGLVVAPPGGTWPAKWSAGVNEQGVVDLELPRLAGLLVTVFADGKYHVKQLTMDHESHIGFVIPRPLSPETWRISGTVSTQDGRTVSSGRVALAYCGSVEIEDGRFTLEVDASKVRKGSTLSAHSPGLGATARQNFGEELLMARGELGPIQIVLESTAILSGHVVWSDGTPAEGMLVSLADPTVLREDMNPPDSLEIRLGGENQVLSAGDGAFALMGMEGRAYRLLVEDHETLLRHVTEPTMPGAGTKIVLDVADRPRTISVTIVDSAGAPVTGAHVRARVVRSRGGGVTSFVDGPEKITGPDGRFRIEGVSWSSATLRIESERTIPTDVPLSELPDDGEVVVSLACPTLIEWTLPGEAPSRIAFLDAEGQELTSVLRDARSTQWGKRIPYSAKAGRLFVEADAAATAVCAYRKGKEIFRLPFTGQPGKTVHVLMP